MPAAPPVRLGVALDRAGHHPGNACLAGEVPHHAVAVGYWTALVDLARRASLGFAVVADSLAFEVLDFSVTSGYRRAPARLDFATE